MEYSMRILAHNAARHGITCNVIIPGVVQTDGWARLSAQQTGNAETLLQRVQPNIPLRGSIMDPTHIGDVVAFLAQPHGGGRYITGQVLVVDGGLTLK